MKIKIVNDSYQNTTTQDMKIGDIAILVEDRFYPGNTILRVPNGFILLQNPGWTWDRDVELPVRILPRGSIITLTVE